MTPSEAVAIYSRDVQRLAESETTGEATYYPIIRALFVDILKPLRLPSNVRQNTNERRTGGGIDVPDLALYDDGGDFVIVPVEAKLPHVDIRTVAMSTERNNQIGRYLDISRTVIVTNVRSFALVIVGSGRSTDGAAVAGRRIEQIADLWPNESAFSSAKPPTSAAAGELAQLLERALTAYATISEPAALAKVLAIQARRAKSALPLQFTQAVKGLQDDFAQALGITFVGDKGEEFFRSSLIQTVFYALFTGWAIHWRSKSHKPFLWQDLPTMLRIPFLGKLFYDIQHPDRIRELGLRDFLDTATETLQRVDPETFFVKLQTPDLVGYDDHASNAITYFYEPFLEAFDPDLRKLLGVWYTPTEIIRYQVLKVEGILKKELGCDLGFADPRVVTLDPCCGTGAYLLEVARCIARTLKEEGYESDLGDRLIDALCNRVVGFEILTAPFVIAHLQLYLALAGMGVEPKSNERLAVFLTNALTGWSGDDQLKLNFPELQDEYDRSRSVKRGNKIIVILGNPPYNRWVDDPSTTEPVLIREESGLVDHYKGIDRDARAKQLGPSRLYAEFGIRKQTLNDSYVRFWRLAEQRIAEHALYGVVSFISNASFYVGRSHPIMRQSLLDSFSQIWIDNVNGDKYRTGKVIPVRMPGAGTTDQSVFTTENDPRGIQVGTGITTLLKLPAKRPGQALVLYRDFWGKADAKRRALLLALNADVSGVGYDVDSPEGPRPYQQINPVQATRYRFASGVAAAGYDDWPSVEELFPAAYQGVNPNRGIEGGLIDVDRNALESRMKAYYSDISFAEFASVHPVLCERRARYDPEDIRNKLRKDTQFDPRKIVPYMLFPLDLRSIYYETAAKLLNERRPELWDNLADNEFLIAVPQPRRVSEARPLLSASLFDLHLHDRGSVGYPAHLLRKLGAQGLFGAQGDLVAGPIANLDPVAWEFIRDAWDLRGGLHEADALQSAGRIFRYVHAIGHTPRYEDDHADSLAAEAMRVPIPTSLDTFNAVSDVGGKMGILLDPTKDARATIRSVIGEAPSLARPSSLSGRALRNEDFVVTISHFGSAKGGWRAVGDGVGNLFINDDVYFANVPAAVWEYELGGYPVLKKWIGHRDAKRRDAKPLNRAECDWLREIVQRLAAHLALRATLDQLYEKVVESTVSFDP